MICRRLYSLHVCSEDRAAKKKKAFMSDRSVSCFLASIQRFMLYMLILSTGGIRKEQFLLQNIPLRIILESLLSELSTFSILNKRFMEPVGRGFG